MDHEKMMNFLSQWIRQLCWVIYSDGVLRLGPETYLCKPWS